MPSAGFRAEGMTAREMLVQVDAGLDPFENLAREDDIFNRVESGSLPEVVRFWTNRECLIRGRARSARYGWYDEELATKLGVLVVERSTGGGVVYQDGGNLNWSFFLRTKGTYLSPRTAFDLASKHLIEALRGLGVPATFSPPNRIDVSSRKVSGMAARSTIHTLLVHGTLLLRSNLEKLNMLCRPPSGCPPVSNLSEWLEGIDARQVISSVTEVLRNSGFQVRVVKERV